MELSTLLRKVKRQFGDEYGIIINDQDIYDWCNEAQANIVRDTTSNDATATVVANTFPYYPVGNVKVKRVSASNYALTYTTRVTLDEDGHNIDQEGTPRFWYVEDGGVFLWPKPVVADTYNVLVTYTTLPTRLSLIAPYLQFVPTPTTPQFLSFAQGLGMDGTDLNVLLDVTFQRVSSNSLLAGKGTGTAAATLCWSITHLAGTQTIRLAVSNGTTLKTADITYSGISNGAQRRFRVTYVASTGIYSLYTIDVVTGVESLVNTNSTMLPAHDIQTLSSPIQIGSINGAAPGNLSKFRINEFQFSTSVTAGSDIIIFDGDNIVETPTDEATSLTASSGQSATLSGAPSLLVYNSNELEVPELYHEDVYKYCLSQAHAKNMNWRASELSMEEFQQNVALRRDEADSADTPMYKSGDPFDYESDWVVY